MSEGLPPSEGEGGDQWYQIAMAAAEYHPDGFLTVNAAGEIDVVNARACEICGIESGDLIGRRPAEALPLHDLHGQSWWELHDPWSSSEDQPELHSEQMLILPSGVVVLLTARYVRMPDGSPLALLLALRDADGRMRAEQAMSELLTTVAHELKSPIASMRGFTGSLLHHWGRFDDEAKQTMLRTIEGDAERVTRLINELLDVARIDSGALAVRPRTVDLREMLTTHVERQIAKGYARDRFHVDVDEAAATIWADADRVEQVLTNLVDNALRHGAGRVCLHTELGELPDGRDGLVIRVCDEGDGIPETNRELVFSRYWQGGSKAGMGLGLYVVRGIAEAHGGDVRLGEFSSCSECGTDGGVMIDVILPVVVPVVDVLE